MYMRNAMTVDKAQFELLTHTAFKAMRLARAVLESDDLEALREQARGLLHYLDAEDRGEA